MVRNNPTQAKKRLEWATPSFSWSIIAITPKGSATLPFVIPSISTLPAAS